jgi:hypothetical protein
MHSFHPIRDLWIVVAYLYCDRPKYRPSHYPVHASDRPSSFGTGFSPCDRPALLQCKPPSLRRESTKRSACLHPSKVFKRLARTNRTIRRYNLGFLWGLWLPVAVQNMIRNSPQRMPAGKRSFIPSCPTLAAGAVS